MDPTTFKYIFIGICIVGCFTGAWAHCKVFSALGEVINPTTKHKH